MNVFKPGDRVVLRRPANDHMKQFLNRGAEITRGNVKGDGYHEVVRLKWDGEQIARMGSFTVEQFDLEVPDPFREAVRQYIESELS